MPFACTINDLKRSKKVSENDRGKHHFSSEMMFSHMEIILVDVNVRHNLKMHVSQLYVDFKPQHFKFWQYFDHLLF